MGRKTPFMDGHYLEVVSKPRITPEGKAQADSKAQQPRQVVSISRGLQRRHRVSDGVMKPLLTWAPSPVNQIHGGIKPAPQPAQPCRKPPAAPHPDNCRRHSNRLLKNGASGRDPALRGFCKCSHIEAYAALCKRRAPWLTAQCLFFNTLLNSVNFSKILSDEVFMKIANSRGLSSDGQPPGGGGFRGRIRTGGADPALPPLRPHGCRQHDRDDGGLRVPSEIPPRERVQGHCPQGAVGPAVRPRHPCRRPVRRAGGRRRPPIRLYRRPAPDQEIRGAHDPFRVPVRCVQRLLRHDLGRAAGVEGHRPLRHPGPHLLAPQFQERAGKAVTGGIRETGSHAADKIPGEAGRDWARRSTCSPGPSVSTIPGSWTRPGRRVTPPRSRSSGARSPAGTTQWPCPAILWPTRTGGRSSKPFSMHPF